MELFLTICDRKKTFIASINRSRQLSQKCADNFRRDCEAFRIICHIEIAVIDE